MIVQGMDASSISHPLLVDASGRVIVSGIELTTTGGKLRVDANGNLYVAPMQPHAVLNETGVTQFLYAQVANNQQLTLYTVGAGKKGYVTSLYMNTQDTTGVAQGGQAQVYNAVPALVHTWGLGAPANGVASAAIPFSVPVVLLAGWSFRVQSFAAGWYIGASITGYEL